MAKFDDHVISQHRALRRLLDEFKYQNTPIPHNYCQVAGSTGFSWVQNCNDQGWVTHIKAWVEPGALMNRGLAELLLTFQELRRLEMLAASGSTVPPQLGGLSKLEHFDVWGVCWQGRLPPNLGEGLQQIRSLKIRYWQDLKLPSCGVQGTLPARWGLTMPFLTSFWLYNNRLTGTLPPEFSGWSNLAEFWVASNQLTGVLPSSYAAWENIWSIDLSNNNLQGEVPNAWWQHEDTLELIQIADNPR